ncbi:MAG TPA: threonine ammonia-lyase [Candidatus Tumulicola sp.]|jgi:threonine dehydratase
MLNPRNGALKSTESSNQRAFPPGNGGLVKEQYDKLSSDWPTADDVRRAASVLEGVALKTPCLPSEALSRLAGADVVLKYENTQHTGSFKMRGAHVKLSSLTRGERRNGIVTASAGNHAQGVAFSASQLGTSSTIVMPHGTPYCKIRSTEAYGGRVLLHGSTVSEATTKAVKIAESNGKSFISPFDDPVIVAGAGTVGLELLQAFPNLDVLLVQVGGGGLISGVALIAKALNPHIRVIGVQTTLYPALHNALNNLPSPVGGATLAEGVAVARVGDLNLSMAKALIDDVLLVDEDALEFAVHLLLEDEKTVTEGAGALGVAALLQHRASFRSARVGLILSGGNIDTGLLAYVISRVRLRERRVVCLRAEVLDVPGGLAGVSEVVARNGANVLEVSHRRTFPNVLAKCMQLDLTVELRKPDDMYAIVRQLNDLGILATLPAVGSA